MRIKLLICYILAALTGAFSQSSLAQSIETSSDTELPYYHEITTLLNSVEYSGFPALMSPQVNLKIDFEKRTWILENIHTYDENGNILLEGGRFGLCAELSTFLFQKLRPTLPDRFDLAFAQTTETGFFPSSDSNHIVLVLGDHSTDTFYIIDPSFHKYGKAEDLSEYELLSTNRTLSFIQQRSPDISFLANQATPLFIKGDSLLSFSVIAVDGKFDKDNFLLTIAAHQRNNVPGRDIIMAGMHKSRLQSYVDTVYLEQLLTPEQIDSLTKKLDGWLKQITSEGEKT